MVLVVLLMLAMFTGSVQGRSFSSGRYYTQEYSISDTPVGSRYFRWDNWGNRYTFQRYKRAEWSSTRGGQWSYVWSNGFWNKQWSDGYSYYYNWVYYTRQLW